MAYPNGQLPASALSRTMIGGELEHKAAASADRMALAFYMARDEALRATDTYRDLDEQWDLWNGPKRHLAAYPGTSIHGKGDAVDFASGINVRSSTAHAWMEKNADDYGWDNPDWATPGRPGFQKDEAWHYEFDHAQDRMRGADQPRFPNAGEIGFGQRGAKVREAQGLLNDNLKPVNQIDEDGDYGWATVVAVIKFQRSRGLAVNGVIGPKTMTLLKKGAAPVVPTKPAKSGPTIYLQPGTRKADQVRALKRFLKAGFPRVNADLNDSGEYDERLVQAVKHWQGKAGLAKTGTIGTRSKIRLDRLGIDWN